MAISFPQSLVLFVLWLAILSCSSADLIADVCNNSANPSLCDQVLRPGRQGNPDLTVLGKIALHQALDQTAKLQENIRSLSSSAATNPELKRRLDTCSQNAISASVKLSRSDRLLLAKDYANMLTEVNGALSDEALCDSQFKTPPSQPAQLKEANGRARDLASIVAAVAKALRGH